MQFLAMGGYAAFVWPAFGLVVLLLGGLFWQSRQAARRREAEVAALRLERRRERERPARPLVARREITPAGSGHESA